MSKLEANEKIDVIYLSKAFDNVDHNILLDKLKLMGVNGKLLKWISSFLSNRMGNRILSDPIHVQLVVPRDLFWDPYCFLTVSTSFLSSFSDDIRVGHPINDDSNIR